MRKIVFILVTLFSGSGFAENSKIIEKSLTADAKQQNRLVDGEIAIRKLVKSGVFRKKPSQRQDYSDYYVPQKPVYVLGAKLISFEREYQQKYIGCCVNPGNGVVLLPEKDTENIESFAQKNKCKFRVGSEVYFVPKEALKGLTGKERQSLVEVSCKDDYLFEDTE